MSEEWGELVNGRLYSKVLGLELVADGENLRLYDSVRQEWLLSPQEQAPAHAAAEARAADEQRRADEETQRSNEEAQRANEEARSRAEAELRAAGEHRRADEEAQERAAAEAEIASLRAELEALRRRNA